MHWFNGASLHKGLAALGIEYKHYPALGGKNPRPLAEMKSFIEKLLPLPEKACLMCSEGNYLECHRHYFLVPLFIELGFTVQQIGRHGALTVDTGPDLKMRLKAAKLWRVADIQELLF